MILLAHINAHFIYVIFNKFSIFIAVAFVLLAVFYFNFNFRTSWLSSWSLGLFLPMHIDRIASYMVSILSSHALAPPHIDNKKQVDSLLWTSCIYPCLCPVLLLFFNFVLKIRNLSCFSVTVDNIGKFLLTDEPEHIRVTRSFVMGILWSSLV